MLELEPINILLRGKKKKKDFKSKRKLVSIYVSRPTAHTVDLTLYCKSRN